MSPAESHQNSPLENRRLLSLLPFHSTPIRMAMRVPRRRQTKSNLPQKSQEDGDVANTDHSSDNIVWCMATPRTKTCKGRKVSNPPKKQCGRLAESMTSHKGVETKRKRWRGHYKQRQDHPHHHQQHQWHQQHKFQHQKMQAEMQRKC